MKTLNQIIAAILWVVGLAMLGAKSSSIFGVIFILPFVFGPQILTHAGVFFVRSTRAQAVLLVALLAYFSWFSYVYVDAFYWHIDPQSAIALFCVGIYAMPVMALLWFLAYRMDMKSRSQSSDGSNAVLDAPHTSS